MHTTIEFQSATMPNQPTKLACSATEKWTHVHRWHLSQAMTLPPRNCNHESHTAAAPWQSCTITIATYPCYTAPDPRPHRPPSHWTRAPVSPLKSLTQPQLPSRPHVHLPAHADVVQARIRHTCLRHVPTRQRHPRAARQAQLRGQQRHRQCRQLPEHPPQLR